MWQVGLRDCDSPVVGLLVRRASVSDFGKTAKAEILALHEGALMEYTVDTSKTRGPPSKQPEEKRKTRTSTPWPGGRPPTGGQEEAKKAGDGGLNETYFRRKVRLQALLEEKLKGVKETVLEAEESSTLSPLSTTAVHGRALVRSCPPAAGVERGGKAVHSQESKDIPENSPPQREEEAKERPEADQVGTKNSTFVDQETEHNRSKDEEALFNRMKVMFLEFHEEVATSVRESLSEEMGQMKEALSTMREDLRRLVCE